MTAKRIEYLNSGRNKIYEVDSDKSTVTGVIGNRRIFMFEGSTTLLREWQEWQNSKVTENKLEE